MDARREKLKQLLDGELDPSEFVKDPTLASLAERIYGMDIKALMAEKGISIPEDSSSAPTVATSGSAPQVEVVGGLDAVPPGLPIPGVVPELEPTISASRSPLLILAGLMVVGVAVFNLLFGLGTLYNPCTTEWCQANAKLIWLSPHLITQDGGWGASGTDVIGIPDIGMIVGGAVLALLGMRRK